MVKFYDTFLETTDPKYARKWGRKVGKNTTVKTMGKIQQAGTAGNLGMPSFLIRFRKRK